MTRAGEHPFLQNAARRVERSHAALERMFRASGYVRPGLVHGATRWARLRRKQRHTRRVRADFATVQEARP